MIIYTIVSVRTHLGMKECTIMNYMKTRDPTRIILGEVGYKDKLCMNYLEVFVKFNHSKLCNLKLWIFLSPFVGYQFFKVFQSIL